MRAFQRLLQSTFIALAVLLTGCGGGSGGGSVASGGIGGTGQIASGTITAFGSIFVNGIEFKNISAANCVIDGINTTGSACQSTLQLGMVVEVNGTFNSAAGTGSATQIVYNDDVSGPISGSTPAGPGAVTRTFTVLNTMVKIDSASTTFVNGAGFNTLTDNDVIEVSGFFDSTGLLNATYVDKKLGLFVDDSTLVEVKGNVSSTMPLLGASMAGDTFVVTGMNNTLVNIKLGSNPNLNDMPGGMVLNNTSVEVQGTYNSTSNTITADRVQPDDTVIGSDGDEVSVEGLITQFVDKSNFLVGGQPVNASTATLNPSTLQLADGLRVEVEGTISGSTIIASDIEARSGDIKIEATVSAVSANSVTVQFFNNPPLTIQVDNQTLMQDNTNAVSNMTLSDISVMNKDFLQIRAFVGMGGTLIASELRRDSAVNASKDILQGPIDSFVPDSSVTVLGITFFSDNNTSFNDATETPVPLSSTFYGMLSTGLTIKIRDKFPPDGIAEEMSLED